MAKKNKKSSTTSQSNKKIQVQEPIFTIEEPKNENKKVNKGDTQVISQGDKKLLRQQQKIQEEELNKKKENKPKQDKKKSNVDVKNESRKRDESKEKRDETASYSQFNYKEFGNQGRRTSNVEKKNLTDELNTSQIKTDWEDINIDKSPVRTEKTSYRKRTQPEHDDEQASSKSPNIEQRNVYSKSDKYDSYKKNDRWISSERHNQNYGNYKETYNSEKNKQRFNPDFQEFLSKLNRENMNYNKVEEISGDLFTAPDDYSLGHCVAEDFSMGAGIAIQFRSEFKKIAFLLDQNVKTGGVAFLENKGRYIYYLVTKKYSGRKPTLETLWQSLNEMKKHMVENNVTKLAIPQIGCGLDKLDWGDVKQMLEYIFQDTDVQIDVYSLDYGQTGLKNKQKGKKKR